MRNPFKYGVRVSGSSFFDRTKVKRAMLNTLDGGSNIVLYGPRRYGKSSLVGELLDDLRRNGTACAELNLMDIASLDDFIAKFARAVYRELAPMTGALNQVAGLFKRITPTVGIDNEGKPELKFTITSAKAGVEALRDVLELPAKLCAKNKRMVIALDEFQEVSELGLGPQFERTMRSVIERQTNVSYIFLGSKAHLIERMFSAKSRPFYNAAQKFTLTRPPAEESAAFLIDRFKSSGISLAKPLAAEMVRRADNVPYYLQALGSWVFNATTGRNSKSVSEPDIEEGFSDLYETERILLEDTFTAHSQSQRLLMRALATEPAAIFSEDYRNRHALASTSTVNTALRRLLAESTIECDSGTYRLANPLLIHHLARQA